MVFHIQEIDASQYVLYDQIPNWFRVESVLVCQAMHGGLGGFSLEDIPLNPSYIKAYNHEGGDNPSQWAAELDLSEWGIFVALDGNRPLGGAAVAPDPAQVFPFDPFNPAELAVLWDLRVHPERRRAGIGAALFDHAAS